MTEQEEDSDTKPIQGLSIAYTPRRKAMAQLAKLPTTAPATGPPQVAPPLLVSAAHVQAKDKNRSTYTKSKGILH